jgi:hypothetical protein
MADIVDRGAAALDMEQPRAGSRRTLQLSELASDFASAVKRVDGRRPQASTSRTGKVYQPGIGPHTESATIRLVVDELVEVDRAYSAHATDVPYPGGGQRCDWCLGGAENWEWAIEAKLLRLLGDNGKPNDNMLSHILSPYPTQHSALMDCVKLAASSFGRNKAILIIAYDYDDFPIDPVIGMFEVLARQLVALGERVTAGFDGLVHPVHAKGSVLAWSIGAAP